MSQVDGKGHSKGVTWRQPLVCALSTVVCTFLAIWAVVAAPVPPAPGVSGLYIAAAVYVPLALWFGVWGSIAGYISCVFMGFYFGYSLPFVLVWALADFFEGFVPLVVYRKLKIGLDYRLRQPKVTYGLTALLLVDMVISAVAAVLTLTEVFFITFMVAIAVLVVQTVFENRRVWVAWLAFGVFVASLVSGVFGVGTLAVFGEIPVDIFPTVFFGWIFGDIIVLSTIGTALMVLLTPYIQKTRAYVREFFS
ncbi:MAG: hypothetical protein NWE94_09400 [Candidatus Bathyarchaeota archaeon]|nr:hypothetical protein [Candidatus Bathyarchaeota archaeon]